MKRQDVVHASRTISIVMGIGAGRVMCIYILISDGNQQERNARSNHKRQQTR